MAKKEWKQQTRFKEEQDPTGGWGQPTARDDPWSASITKYSRGRTDGSGWGPDGGGGNTTTAGGGKVSHWSSWGQSIRNGQNTPQNELKKTDTSRRSGGTRTTLSAQDQSNILNSLLHNPGTQKVPFSQYQQNKPQLKQAPPNLKLPQNMHQQQHYGTTPTQWGSTWDDIPEEDEDELEYVDDNEWGYPDNQPQYQHGYSPEPAPYPSPPSKTLSNALGAPGAAKPFGSPPNSQDHRLIESHGVALSSAYKALYSQDRPAKERFHWSFSPDKDERVRSVMQWIQGMSEGVGALGLQKFLQSGKRGALFVNADFKSHQSPKEPAFDWLPLDHLKDTLDKILQESVALYDPATQVIVFVFLLSKTGNSMAIWRRKIPVAEVFRTTYADVIGETIANLTADYRVWVDELPSKTQPTKQRRVLSKRKWWKPWMSKPGP